MIDELSTDEMEAIIFDYSAEQRAEVASDRNPVVFWSEDPDRVRYRILLPKLVRTEPAPRSGPDGPLRTRR